MKNTLDNTKKKLVKCKHCSKEFVPVNNNQKYCSMECKRIEYNRKRRNKEHFSTNHCLYCGKELVNKHSSERYCPGGVCYKLFRRLKRKKADIEQIRINREKQRLKKTLNGFDILYKETNEKWYWEAFKGNKMVLSSEQFNTFVECERDSVVAFR